MNENYSRLPAHMVDGARLYVERGIEPGGFLIAVLCNDLVEAAGRADSLNSKCLAEWAAWVYCEVPRAAWGSKANVDAWITNGGMLGFKS